MGGLWILSCKRETVTLHAYAAPSEAADVSLAPVLTPDAPLPHLTYHPTLTWPGDLCRDQGGAARFARPTAGQGAHQGILKAGQGVAQESMVRGEADKPSQEPEPPQGQMEVHL
ncbi:hypothetical protein EHS25_005554 [Saitozyma podzolica]|uniref:Uncharacterized protein n=1 Tax=Saitozyma podzolica TaxID=1890683 RepID=A0A427XXT6_9TREE|nr:hypothetical protein EHS25_005554 [Saitozyma podzolica]